MQPSSYHFRLLVENRKDYLVFMLDPDGPVDNPFKDDEEPGMA